MGSLFILLVASCEIVTGYDLIAVVPRFYLVRVQKCGALPIFGQLCASVFVILSTSPHPKAFHLQPH
jgi:hypothetical protein